MESKRRTIHLKIKYLDNYYDDDEPEVVKRTLDLIPNVDADLLKEDLYRICKVSKDKVIKIRNADGDFVPISFLSDPDVPDRYFHIEITNISYIDIPNAGGLQDAYHDAVQQKVRTMESRIMQSEMLLPQLEWRKQAHAEETINGLLYKVGFLNKRFDELLPQVEKLAIKTPPTTAT